MSQDMVNHPPHYKDASGVECIEITKHMGFLSGNCFKYLFRAGRKGDLLEDLRKASWYAERQWKRTRGDYPLPMRSIFRMKIDRVISSRKENGQENIAQIMTYIADRRWWHVYDGIEQMIESLVDE